MASPAADGAAAAAAGVAAIAGGSLGEHLVRRDGICIEFQQQQLRHQVRSSGLLSLVAVRLQPVLLLLFLFLLLRSLFLSLSEPLDQSSDGDLHSSCNSIDLLLVHSQK